MERLILRLTHWVIRLRPVALGLMIALAFLLKFLPPEGTVRAGFLLFLGRFHPLVVHLPIAFVLLLPVFEIPLPFLARPARRNASAILLFSAVISVVGAILLGWLLSYAGGFQGALLLQHAWAAVGTGTLLALAALVWNLDVPRIGLILASVASVSLTGHLGGELTHGSTYLTEYAPEPIKSLLRGSADHIPIKADTTVYAAVIAPAFNRSCVQCHNAGTANGGLDLSTLAGLMKGGQDGPAILPGKPSESLLIKRVCLAPDDRKSMPPAPKPPLTSAELSILRAWIASGAKADMEITDLAGLPAEGKNLVASRRRALRPRPPEIADPTKSMPEILAAAKQAGVRILPLSTNPREGLSLLTFGQGANLTDSKLGMILPAAPFLVEAGLADTGITDASMGKITGFRNLRRLDLSRTALTGTGASAILALPHLEVLILTGTGVDDAWIRGIHPGPSLSTLGLFQTKITDNAIQEFRKAHPKINVYGPVKVIPTEHPAPTPDASPAKGAVPAAALEKSPLQKQMDLLAEGMKGLSTHIADTNRQSETISILETLKKTVMDAKAMDPIKTSTVPASEKERFLAGYRAQLDNLTAVFSSIEDHVKTARYDEAKTLLAKASEIKAEGHRQFKADAAIASGQPPSPATSPSPLPSPLPSPSPSTSATNSSGAIKQAEPIFPAPQPHNPELRSEMKVLAASMKQLSASIADPSKQSENIALLETMIKAVTSSFEMTPPKMELIPGSDHTAFIADYHAALHKLSDSLSELEDALKSGHYEEAKVLLERITQLKKEGHANFKE
jgi:soluble cytochrome b562/uncharacterized membrane protein/mono/diheme cytochrome c family protein